MAHLTYFTGPMNCGKSTLALQVDYTESTAGRRGLRFGVRLRHGLVGLRCSASARST